MVAKGCEESGVLRLFLEKQQRGWPWLAVLQVAMHSKETARRRDAKRAQSQNQLASQMCGKMPPSASD